MAPLWALLIASTAICTTATTALAQAAPSTKPTADANLSSRLDIEARLAGMLEYMVPQSIYVVSS